MPKNIALWHLVLNLFFGCCTCHRRRDSQYGKRALIEQLLNKLQTKHTLPCPVIFQGICRSCYSRFTPRGLALTIVLRSKTGRSGIGSSMIWIMIASSKYHPSTSAAKNAAPVATRKVAPSALPAAVYHRDAAAKLKPMVAQMKMTTKIPLVRVEQMRKTKESIARASG